MLRRVTLFVLLLGLVASTAFARPYGRHDMRRALGVRDTAEGQQRYVDTGFIRQVLGDLYAHASNFPPQFDTEQDRQRAQKDIQFIMHALSVLVEKPAPDPRLLLDAAIACSIGHNFDIPRAAENAVKYFERLLALNPENPAANQQYGAFLGNTGQAKQGIPYLKKAQALGVAEATYSLGLSYMILGDKTAALENLEKFQSMRPQDSRVATLIKALRDKNTKFETVVHGKTAP